MLKFGCSNYVTSSKLIQVQYALGNIISSVLSLDVKMMDQRKKCTGHLTAEGIVHGKSAEEPNGSAATWGSRGGDLAINRKTSQGAES